jgi:hypothetical protein
VSILVLDALAEAQGVALGEPDEETQPVSDGEPVGVGVPDADAVEEREERPEGVDETEGVEDAQPDAERESAGEPLAEGEWLDVTDADGVREEVALRVPLRLPVAPGVHDEDGDPDSVVLAEVEARAERVTALVGVSRVEAEWL